MLNSRILRPCFLAASLAAVLGAAALADDVKPTPTAPPTAVAKPETKPSVWGDRLTRLREWSRKRAEENAPFDAAANEAFAKELLADIDLSKLSVSEIESGWILIRAVPDAATKAKARVAEFAALRDTEGGKAAILLAEMSRMSPDQAAAVKASWDHPGLEGALDARGLRSRLQQVDMLRNLEPQERAEYASRVLEWAKKFGPATSTTDMRFTPGYMKALRDLGEAVPPAKFESTRVALLGVLTAARDEAVAAGNSEDAKQLDKLRARLDSAAMKGMLVGHPAPALTFRKVIDLNGTPTWNSLEDLKGKVVVLDFWATWCGPCVGSFPNVRELRKHYSPDDVVILGVTSPQGAIHWKGKPAQPFKDDIEGEMNTMAEYVKAMDMTWPVVFTEQEVFNADYDVSGIPHLAIIDTTGKLRFNDLHPSMPLSEKAEKIDALLKEAGRTPPPAPVQAPESK